MLKILIISILIIPQLLFANKTTVDLQPILYSQMRLQSGYSDIYNQYLSPTAQTFLKESLERPLIKDYSLKAEHKLRRFFNDLHFRKAFSYIAWNQFLFSVNKQHWDEYTLALLEYYLFRKILHFKEIIDDYRTKTRTRTILADFLWHLDKPSNINKDNVAIRFLKEFDRVKTCYKNKFKHPPSDLQTDTFDSSNVSIVHILKRLILNRTFYKNQIKALNRLDQMISCVKSDFPQIAPSTKGVLKKLRINKSHNFLEFNPQKIDNALSKGLLSTTGFIDGNDILILRANGHPIQRTNFISYEEKLNAIKHTVFKKNLEEQWDHKEDFLMIQDMLLALQEAKDLNVNPIEHVFQLKDRIIYQDKKTTLTEKDIINFKKHPLWAQYSQSIHPPQPQHHVSKILRSPDGIFYVWPIRSPNINQISTFRSEQVFRNIISSLSHLSLSFAIIDPFFFKGTMGLALINHLITKLQIKRSRFQLIVLERDKDFSKKYPEVRILFNFMRAYMALNPDRVLTLPSYTKDKSSASWRHLITTSQNIFEKLFLINPENWTEISNYPTHYTKSLVIRGPIVTVTLNEYYDVIYKSLKHDWKAARNDRQNPKYRDFISKVYETVASNWAKRCYIQSTEHMSIEEKVESTLCSIDVIQRYKNTYSTKFPNYDKLTNMNLKKETNFPSPQKIQMTKNNPNTLRHEPLEQILNSILQAQSQILIQGNILNNPQIVESLVQKKKQGINIYILFHLPRHTDLKEVERSSYTKLRRANIPLKSEAHFNKEHLEQIKKRKNMVLSIDGLNARNESIPGTPIYIVGSTNENILGPPLNQLQILTYDEISVAAHDNKFWFLWREGFKH